MKNVFGFYTKRDGLVVSYKDVDLRVIPVKDLVSVSGTMVRFVNNGVVEDRGILIDFPDDGLKVVEYKGFGVTILSIMEIQE